MTIPHVTITPLARGVGTQREDRLVDDLRYFKFYTYFWITDSAFNANEHPHLTGEQAKLIDATIDSYNAAIRNIVDEQRQHGRQWFIVDIASALERIAFRRYREIGQDPPGGPYEFPQGWLAALQAASLPELTTHYLTLAHNQLQRGGLFSLDGVHATTMGYGLMAYEFIKVMRDEAGVTFINPITGVERPEPIEINYAKLLHRDTLVRTPPGLLDDAVRVMNWLEDWIGLRTILSGVA
jgi:hypothetical protein